MNDDKYMAFQLKDLKRFISENALDMMEPITGDEIAFNAIYNEGVRCLANRLIYDLTEIAEQK